MKKKKYYTAPVMRVYDMKPANIICASPVTPSGETETEGLKEDEEFSF